MVAFAQQKTYHSTGGDAQTDIIWKETKSNGKIRLHTEQGTEKQDYVTDNLYRTLIWRVISPTENTNLTIAYNKGMYELSGMFHGKRISKTVKSKGYAWYQNIAFNAGVCLRNRSSIKYECFRPDNLKLYTMTAELQGKETVGNKTTNKVKVCLTGILSAFWSCTYFFDTETGNFIMYKGVNGAPGTPETIITLKQ